MIKTANPESDAYCVLGQIVEAVNMLAKAGKAYRLLPEIRSNLVMAKEGAKTTGDIAGIPGRLTEVFGRITAAAYPAWGASRYTAKILLAILQLDPSRRAAMEIKYSEELVDLIKREGIDIERLDVESGKSLSDLLKGCLKNGKLPSALYTEGGFAREGAIIITGQNAVDVAKTVIRISELLPD
ncbi:MAG: thiamine-phosphate synthase family protein [Thermacetogeniaceae bacterium]